MFKKNLIMLEEWLLVRKSFWLLFVYILRSVFLILFISLLIYWFTYFISTLPEGLFLLKVFLWFIILLWIILTLLTIISWIVLFHFDIVICSDQKIFRFKLWLFFKDNVDIIELYRIQEVRVNMSNFIKILLNIWDIRLIEPNDIVKEVHRLDEPKRVALAISKEKDKLIARRRKKEIEVEKDEIESDIVKDNEIQ